MLQCVFVQCVLFIFLMILVVVVDSERMEAMDIVLGPKNLVYYNYTHYVIKRKN